MELRVVTWNIRAAIGPGPFPDRWWTRIDADRLRAIGSFVAGLDADVVALQEVALLSRDGDLVDNAGDLARQLGMEVRYGAVRTFAVTDGDAATGVGCFGNALLSRLPISASRTVALPMAPADAFVEPPGADHPVAGVRYADAPRPHPRAALPAPGRGRPACAIGTTHLSHIGSGERLLQAEATVAALGGAAAGTSCSATSMPPIDAPELAPFADWTDGFAEPPGDPRPDLDRRRRAHRPRAGARRIGPVAVGRCARRATSATTSRSSPSRVCPERSSLRHSS